MCLHVRQNRILPSWMAEGCPEPRHRLGAEYALCAVVQHHGRTPASGHYTAGARACLPAAEGGIE